MLIGLYCPDSNSKFLNFNAFRFGSGQYRLFKLNYSTSETDMVPKRTNVHQLIKMAWDADKVRLSSVHGKSRSSRRQIGIPELRDVILYGDREEEEDRYRISHWTYALRNRDVDGFDIRIIFDVEGFPDVVVVTLMHVYPR
jgi:hypothetical protein